jgi:hypothetical protein
MQKEIKMIARLGLVFLLMAGLQVVVSAQGRGRGGGGSGGGPRGGRSDTGMGSARLQQQNLEQADQELRDHPGMAVKLQTTADELRSGYQAAMTTNPNLKFDQYVEATRLAANLGATNPNVTTGAILTGISSHKSIGQTLQDLGLSKEQAKEAQKRTDKEIKDAKRT